jgi:type I restriction enzyme, S subunit
MSWVNYKIGDFLTRSKEPVKIQGQEEYTLVTIRMYHKGVAKRSHVKGSSIKSPTLYKVRAGQFILSGIDARNRAFGIVPEELDGAVVTNDFWTHDIDTSIIDINFFYWFTTTPQFYEACIKASEGTTNRQRLQADKFYSFDVFLPSIAEQQVWVERISYIQNKHEQLDKKLDQQQTYLQLLRQTILQEAVQGKLTKQDPTDVPATELLKHIKAEKEKLIKAGKLKKEKELPPITEHEIFFELPEGWTICRLEELGDPKYPFSYGVLKPGIEDPNGVLIVKSQHIYDSKVAENINTRITPELDKEFKRTKIKGGELLMNLVGASIGRCAIAPEWLIGANVSRAVAVLTINKHVNTEFLLYSLSAFLTEENIKKNSAGSAQPVLNLGTVREFVIPLPPVAEQQRIVAKVQQLQQQLSQLEALVQQSRQYAQQLLQVILKEAFKQHPKIYDLNQKISLVAE